LGHLHVLLLVLANRHDRASVDEDVRRHEQRVTEKSHVGFETTGDLVFVAGGSFEQTLTDAAREEPRELAYLRHIRLAEERGSLRV
jgi:hypothetical protein